MSKDRCTRRQVLAAGAALSSKLLQGAAAQSRVIESSRWKLDLSEKGAVARLTHKPSGQVLIDAGADAPAYELTTAQRTENDLSAAVTSEPLTTARGKGFRFVSEHADKTVIMEVVEAREHGGLEFRLRVRNRTQTPITAIKYPVLIAPAQLGASPEDDAILLPFYDGGVVENPAREFGRNPSAHRTYPGPASCQVVAYYDSTAGIYVASHDPNGHGKLVGATRRKDSRFDLSVSHLQPAIVQEEIEIPYPVVLDSFVGDWYGAAEKYRTWSLNQPWAREPLETSKKVPQWMREGAIMGEFDPTRLPLEAQRAQFQQMREWFTVPIVPNNRGWESGGMWMSPWYLPPQPSPEEFRKSAQLVKEIGGRGMIMLSGYRWTLEQIDGKGRFISQEEFDRTVAPEAQCGRDGKPQFWTREPGTGTSWMPTRWSRICRATGRATREALETARYCVQAGYPVIHWDQENAGNYGNSVCYSTSHGHPPGDGIWIHQALENLYRRFWADLAPMTPDFAVSMEQANELYMPYLTMAQSRPFTVGNIFTNIRPMTRVVPLLNYLHHEHFFGWAAYYPWRLAPDNQKFLPELARASLAKGFNCGLMPGVSMSNLRRQPKNELDKYLKLFKSCMEGYSGYARSALMYGRMMRPLDLPVPKRTFEREGLPPLPFPVVDNSVWHNLNGSVTVVLINHSEEVQTATVDFARVPGWSGDMKALRFNPAETPLTGRSSKIDVAPLSMTAIRFSRS